MYYVVENDEVRNGTRQEFEEKNDTIAVYTSSEWKQEEELKKEYRLREPAGRIRFCKIESHSEYLFGTMRLPSKEEGKDTFYFYILNEKIILVDDTGMVITAIAGIATGKYRRAYDLERFLYDFLVSFISEDFISLEEIEKQISNVEEEILKRQIEGANLKLLAIKKVLARFSGFYTQLTFMGQELMDNQIDFFEKDDIRTFDMFKDRAGRMANQTQLLREYAMQVQDVYQSQIGIEQNNVMKMLTIVTTLVLPLTLIAGWYGMNFQNMPELKSPYGYPVIIGISVAVVAAILFVFKKKKFW